MSKVYLMVTITGRGQGEQFAALNRTENLPVMMVALGKGRPVMKYWTASDWREVKK